MATLVDANVLLDVVTRDPKWAPWSKRALDAEEALGRLTINPIVFAELAAGFGTLAALDAAFPESWIAREPLPYEAAFPASRAFLADRRRGGVRTSPLPGFLIGAHAEVAGLRRLTRDRARFATYFPTVTIVAP